MRDFDAARFAATALVRAPGRSALMLLAMAIGVASVVVLTGLGEGARRYVSGEFAALGTNLLIVIPGRTETTGGAPALVVGQTPRDLTLDDALVLRRDYRVRRVAPLVVGAAAVSFKGREREVPILGGTADMLAVRHWTLSLGRFLPAGDPRRASPVAVIGTRLRQELFQDENPIGQWLRIGDRRFRVIGVLGDGGRSIGVDMQEVAIIPVTAAQALFNAPSMFRVLVEAIDRDAMDGARTHILRTIAERHQGEEDITVITQDAVVATFDRIFGTLTMAVGGIAAISLAVAGVLIMNVMLVAVSQRTSEIGLLKAVGAAPGQILRLFLLEATLLSLLGAAVGLLLGIAGSAAIAKLYPVINPAAPTWAIVAATLVALSSGLLFGYLPARRAAGLDPIVALGSAGR